MAELPSSGTGRGAGGGMGAELRGVNELPGGVRVQDHAPGGGRSPERHPDRPPGGWIGGEGPLFRTRTGRSPSGRQGGLLAKTLRPLPLGKTEEDAETGERTSHGGFADIESRYRQRYADLAVHPEVRDVFRTRSRMVTAIREFMDGEGFLEVETPALQPLYGGRIGRPFVTKHNALDQTMYLRIADELYLKRLIVGGFDRVYEIAKDFRNEGLVTSTTPSSPCWSSTRPLPTTTT